MYLLQKFCMYTVIKILHTFELYNSYANIYVILHLTSVYRKSQINNMLHTWHFTVLANSESIYAKNNLLSDNIQTYVHCTCLVLHKFNYNKSSFNYNVCSEILQHHLYLVNIELSWKFIYFSFIRKSVRAPLHVSRWTVDDCKIRTDI